MDMAMNKMTMLVMFLSLAFVGKTEARGTGTFTCSIPGFTNHQMTIPMSLVCDGVITCGLGEDEKDCPVHILIATGFTRSNGIKTEVLDLSENPSAIPSSCSGIEDFPVQIGDAVGGNVNSVPLICGGSDTSYKVYNDCYKLEGKTWRKVTSGGLNVKRSNAAVIVNDQKLAIFGGIDEKDNRLDSVEIVDGNGQSQDNSNNLPETIHSHAIACSINSSVAIFSGGWVDGSRSRQTFFYKHETRTFSPGPELNTARESHATGTLIDQETNEVIPMVTGGYNYPETLDSTEILLDGQWKQVASSVGQKLPKRLYGLQTVQSGNDVIAIGGYDGRNFSGSIYKFSCRSRNCAWTTLPQTLQYPRENFVAMPINCN